MSARRALVAAVAAAVLGVPALARACAVCSAAGAEANRKAFADTTVFLSLLPLGLIAWGLVWATRKGRDVLRNEFRESDEPAPPAEQDARRG